MCMNPIVDCHIPSLRHIDCRLDMTSQKFSDQCNHKYRLDKIDYSLKDKIIINYYNKLKGYILAMERLGNHRVSSTI